MPREENFVASLRIVNNPKRLNTLKNNTRRITRIFNVFVLILQSLHAKILALLSLTYINRRFVWGFLRITLTSLKCFKTIFFCFLVFVEVN